MPGSGRAASAISSFSLSVRLRQRDGGRRYNPQNIYNMRPEQIHYDIADWAIAGNRLPDVADSLWFYNPFSVICRGNFPSRVGQLAIRIGDHCFYNPTEAYALT